MHGATIKMLKIVQLEEINEKKCASCWLFSRILEI